MTSDERAQILVTARLLRAAENIHWLATGLTILPAAAIIFGSPNRVPAVTAIVLGLVSTFYCIRISFDARLFDDIAAERLTTSDLDFALHQNGGRSWPDRCSGARRLVMIAAAATIAQVIAVVLIGC